ncbi:kinesin-like protein KIN-7N isoform X2 [Prosopis cineraria]|uniref:kinesin-like protein KIN-7N isoform X2 n=1 Tax=Prosopis cineraria TaxID=364024 RepID=UPI00240F74F3|nr:kinesin-like protein KIN-7N isoform X2 [Prosopis cineraria]
MKGGFVNSHQFYGSLNDSKVKRKYLCLLEDFLELQKEFISKKKKLQAHEQKREILVEEVRFLRQRCNYLTKIQLSKVGSELSVDQNVDALDVLIRKDLNYIVHEEGTGREELAWMKSCIKKKLHNCLTNDNKGGKKKISWEEKVSLKV